MKLSYFTDESINGTIILKSCLAFLWSNNSMPKYILTINAYVYSPNYMYEIVHEALFVIKMVMFNYRIDKYYCEFTEKNTIIQ